tara:strand:- start:695 stop:967 length:273 start_codon:yes stop_codon:yes gene_type:complete
MLDRQDIIVFLKRHDKSFGIKENIYYAAKAFKTNSVISYLSRLNKDDDLDYDDAEQVFGLLIKYLKGEADLVWEEGKILFKLLDGGKDNE